MRRDGRREQGRIEEGRGKEGGRRKERSGEEGKRRERRRVNCQKDEDQQFSKQANLLVLNDICLSILNTKMSKLTFPVVFLPLKNQQLHNFYRIL